MCYLPRETWRACPREVKVDIMEGSCRGGGVPISPISSDFFDAIVRRWTPDRYAEYGDERLLRLLNEYCDE